MMTPSSTKEERTGVQAGGLVGDGDPEKLNIAESRVRGGQRGRTWRWGEGPCEEVAGCGHTPPILQL